MNLSRQQLADLFGVTPRTISSWQCEPDFPQPAREGRSNAYDATACVKWWRDREVGKLIEGDDGGLLNLDQERARLARSQREKVELELRVRRDELVDAAGVVRQFRHAATTAQTAILAVPDRLAAVIAAESDPDRVHEKLKQELESALSVLADRWREYAAEAEATKEVRSDG